MGEKIDSLSCSKGNKAKKKFQAWFLHLFFARQKPRVSFIVNNWTLKNEANYEIIIIINPFVMNTFAVKVNSTQQGQLAKVRVCVSPTKIFHNKKPLENCKTFKIQTRWHVCSNTFYLILLNAQTQHWRMLALWVWTWCKLDFWGS